MILPLEISTISQCAVLLTSFEQALSLLEMFKIQARLIPVLYHFQYLLHRLYF